MSPVLDFCVGAAIVLFAQEFLPEKRARSCQSKLSYGSPAFALLKGLEGDRNIFR